MPPTIRSGNKEDSSRGGDKKSDLVCRVKYNNTLPEIPFDPKFVAYPFDPNRFLQYQSTSLEKSYKHELLTEHDLGVVIDLINPNTYVTQENAYLDMDDERLLEEDLSATQDGKRSRHHNKNVSWLRKTEYISTENNRQFSAEKVEARIGFNMRKNQRDLNMYQDRESQINAIEATFAAAQQPITRHYSKPGVEPVEVLPLLPDFDMWRYPCAQVIFDSDPAPKGRSVPAQMEEMSQAMIRGMRDENDDQFVAYFLPLPETMLKRKRDSQEGVDYMEADEYTYFLAREYNWNVKNKASRGYEETYFFVFRNDSVTYNELETRVRLSKRRKVGSTGMPSSNSRLIVKHRALNEQEVAVLDSRMQMLEPPAEEEQAEEAEDNAEANENQDSDNERNAAEDEDKGSRHSDAEEEEKHNRLSDLSSEDSDDEATHKKNEEEAIFGSDSD